MRCGKILALLTLSALLTGCANAEHAGGLSNSDEIDLSASTSYDRRSTPTENAEKSTSTSGAEQSSSTSNEQSTSTSSAEQSTSTSSAEQSSSTSSAEKSSSTSDAEQSSSTIGGEQSSSASSETHEPSNSQTEPSVVLTTEFPEYGTDVTEIKYTITNNSDLDFAYSREFYLQRSDNGQWTNIPFTNESFNSLGIILSAQSSANGSVVLANRVELPLSPGKYRLGKGDGNTVYGEFTVK